MATVMSAGANELASLVLLVGVGLGCRRLGIVTTEAQRALSRLLLQVVFPAVIVTSFENARFSSDAATEILTVLGIAVAIHIGSFALSLLIYRRCSPPTRRVLRFVAVFSNCATLGLPVLAIEFGPEGAMYASTWYAVYTLLVWTLGVAIYASAGGALKAASQSLLNVGVASVAIGVTLFAMSWRLPSPASTAIDAIATMGVPLAVFRMGGYLSDVVDLGVRSMLSDRTAYIGSLVRLLVVPMGTLLALRALPLGLGHHVIAACTVLAGMPAGLNTPVFADTYGGDVTAATRSVALSTILSAVTLPLISIVASKWQ